MFFTHCPSFSKDFPSFFQGMFQPVPSPGGFFCAIFQEHHPGAPARASGPNVRDLSGGRTPHGKTFKKWG